MKMKTELTLDGSDYITCVQDYYHLVICTSAIRTFLSIGRVPPTLYLHISKSPFKGSRKLEFIYSNWVKFTAGLKCLCPSEKPQALYIYSGFSLLVKEHFNHDLQEGSVFYFIFSLD